MRKNWLFLVLATTFVFANYKVDAQSPVRTINTGDKEIALADVLFGQGSYFNAIDYYQDLKNKDERNPFYTYIIGECLRFTRDYVPSAHYYAEAYYLDKNDFPASAFYAGQMYKQQGEYQQAITWFKQFLEDNKKTSGGASRNDPYHRKLSQKDIKKFKKLAQIEIDGCIMAMASIKEPQPVNIINCGPNVNTAYTELSPYPLGDTVLLFSTMNQNNVIYTTKGTRGSEIKEHFMTSHKQMRTDVVDSFEWPLAFRDGDFNAPGFHTGNGCYSPGGDRFYYTRCGEGDSAKIICSIYYSQFGAHGWEPSVLVGGNVNEPGSSNTMPFVAKVGKKEVLYFSSDRKLQSRGGYDIWYSIIDPRSGTFRRPQNCGKQVNTPSDEITPYYDTRVGKLYFSSNGKKSFGGFDIYSADGGPSRYTNIQNMGYPINTSADELYYIKDPIGKPEGYLVSNRIGTIALKNPTCCNDIWRVQNEPRLVIIGKVVDKKTQQLLSQDVVKMTDQKGELVTFNSDDGNFTFQMTRNHSYVITADKPGYTSSRATVSTMSVKRSDKDDTVNVTIFLDTIKKSFYVSNIYYDYDQATLRPESVASLDTVVAFLKDNASISVEIYSYTDGKGTPEYNEALSQRRAQSVLDYLEKNGIERARMTAKGFGQRNPVAAETMDGGKDNPEGRQLNRRTEFRIIGDLPTRRVLFNSAVKGTMDQQEKNLKLEPEAEDEPASPGVKPAKEDAE